MTIPAHARGKTRDSKVYKPLDEIQIDSVPNPEPMGLSADTRFNYLRILRDRFSHTFRMCGIQDKTTDACIDGIELIISTMSGAQRQPRSIQHICNMLELNFDLTPSENGAVKIKFISTLLLPYTKNRMVLLKDTGGRL